MPVTVLVTFLALPPAPPEPPTPTATAPPALPDTTAANSSSESAARRRTGPGIPAGAANQRFVLTLDQGDVAQVATVDTANATMTGTKIESDEDHPIGVISGTECTNTGQGACDHMEEMLTGVRLWGLEFVAHFGRN